MGTFQMSNLMQQLLRDSGIMFHSFVENVQSSTDSCNHTSVNSLMLPERDQYRTERSESHRERFESICVRSK